MMPSPHDTHTSASTLVMQDLTPSQKPSDGELTVDEASFILDTTLKSKHREEPSILRFVDSFVRCKNIAQASQEAGIHQSIGYKYRHTKDIALAIQKLTDRSYIKYGFDASEIIERTKEMVDFDPIQLQNPDGTFKSNLYDVAPEARRNLKKLKVRNIYGEVEDINGVKTNIIRGEVIEYEFYDKLKAIDLVGREKDIFKQTSVVEHTVSKDMASILLDSAKRGAIESKRVVDIQGEVVR